jgi:glyoxylase-like metal-dependent hydrolase (beta-lactamase superfamily II)
LGGVYDLQLAADLPCRAHKDEEPIVAGAPKWAGALMQRQLHGPKAISYFSGEPTLDFGDFSVRVVFTPGHTPGGVCFVFDGFVFTGDTLFNQGIGRTDLPGGDGQTLVGSLTRLLAELDDSLLVFSGHGPSWTVGEAKPWWEWATRQGYL